jgi:hypothetical protein
LTAEPGCSHWLAAWRDPIPDSAQLAAGANPGGEEKNRGTDVALSLERLEKKENRGAATCLTTVPGASLQSVSK